MFSYLVLLCIHTHKLRHSLITVNSSLLYLLDYVPLIYYSLKNCYQLMMP